MALSVDEIVAALSARAPNDTELRELGIFLNRAPAPSEAALQVFLSEHLLDRMAGFVMQNHIGGLRNEASRVLAWYYMAGCALIPDNHRAKETLERYVEQGVLERGQLSQPSTQIQDGSVRQGVELFREAYSAFTAAAASMRASSGS